MFFYNYVDPQKIQNILQQLVKQYEKIIPEQKLAEAYYSPNNPDKNKYIPVPARSFEDLRLRVEEQQNRTKKFIAKLKDLERQLLEIKRNHEAKTMKKIDGIKQRQVKLTERILSTQKKLEVLMQKGVGCNDVDLHIKNKVDSMLQELNKPNQFKGRLNELIPQFNYYLQTAQSNFELIDQIDDATLEAIINFLSLQTDGITSLVQIVNKDIKDLAIIKGSK